MKWGNKPAMLLASFILSPAFAQQELPMCAFLDRLVLAAEQDFKDLRGPFDFNRARYAGTLTTQGYTTCFTSIYEGTKTYSCERRLPDDASAARAEWVRASQEADQCYSGRSNLVLRNDRSLRFKTKPHGADVRVHYQRLERSTSATYLLRVQVSAHDPE